jgi:serine phosphatase RsbU (regulator of sigma subunit)
MPVIFSNQPTCMFQPTFQASAKTARSLANVQHRLLPCRLPELDNVECSVMCRQAEIVGGDFYDVLRLPTGELGIAIGDVSGKGLEVEGAQPW